MIKYFSLLLSLLIIITFLSSCSKNNPANPGTTTYVQPKTGSSFTYDEYSTDTTTTMPIASTRDTSVQTFVQSGMSYNGKSNVSKIISVKRFSSDTTYINYESNGDISAFISDGSSVMSWITFPVSSKNTVSVTLSDTTIDISGVSMRMKMTLVTSYVGSENMTVKGQSISVIKMKQSYNTAVTTAGVTETQSSSSYFYFAPSLGYIAKSEVPVQAGPFGGMKSEGNLSILINYNLK